MAAALINIRCVKNDIIAFFFFREREQSIGIREEGRNFISFQGNNRLRHHVIILQGKKEAKKFPKGKNINLKRKIIMANIGRKTSRASAHAFKFFFFY